MPKVEKIMPEEVAAELSPIERIVAHIENGYALQDEDVEYFEKINQAFRIVFAVDTPAKARKKLIAFFGKKENLAQLVNDVTIVYGDFFEINKNALRVIQEKRHLDLHRRATKAEDYAAAGRALIAIDKLYGLYSKEDDVPTSARRLPKPKRTSDPAAFHEMNKRLHE